MKAPFTWFGGKSRVAPLVWAAFGNVAHYVEPFAGSLAVLLQRPHPAHVETVNDLDAYLANFWRALKADPEAVAHHADWPVNEVDLHARHRWLVNLDLFRESMLADPDYWDAQVAGWWVWGLSAWIGSGWCAPYTEPSRQLPHLGDAGKGTHRLRDRGNLRAYMERLAARLRPVRVCCGDWSRVLGPSVLRAGGSPCGVFLDPPYDVPGQRYSTRGDPDLPERVAKWAASNGNRTELRIALCGYEGTFDPPPGWWEVPWLAVGGYGSQAGPGMNGNRSRERIWFSPHCQRTGHQIALDFTGGGHVVTEGPETATREPRGPRGCLDTPGTPRAL